MVLSSSRSALTLELDVAELWAHYFHVQDLTKQECEQYLTDLCKIHFSSITDKEISCFVTDVMPLIGNRLLDLNSIKMRIKDELFENA